MKIYLGADHRGFKLKAKLINWLATLDHQVEDVGASKFDPTDDYTDFAFNVAQKVVNKVDALGVVICGSGIGVTIASNKVKGAMASTVCSVDEVVHGRERDGLNILALAADDTDIDQAKELIKAFLTARPQNKPRFLRRVNKIKKYEATHFKV